MSQYSAPSNGIMIGLFVVIGLFMIPWWGWLIIGLILWAVWWSINQ